MKKIYGYKEKDLFGLTEFIENNSTKPLSTCFYEYGLLSGKAKGTVRNMYYALMKNSTTDSELKSIYLKDKPINVSAGKPFSEEENKRVNDYVINAVRRGASVRTATAELSKGDMKLALRYQNKFRNNLKTDKNLKEQYLSLVGKKEDDKNYTELVKSVIGDALFNNLVDAVTKLIRKINFDYNKENEFLKQKLKTMEKDSAI